ncbi:AcrB/AcrD/AcrF family protein [Advenella kashmirensis WT001]|uniref:AcrB/AcrD/AcrF family protein n=1 Tax=Advenella kashmirensis (strain DSM 17095 / LMG 22695 / WT001) TaxID=1036672 RepID=I3U9G2_ADVKW|nr:AcrB/AcrD/AcrF family protein [Advenella kashmirensis WT001]
MSLSRPFILRPVATSLLALAVAVMGMVAFFLMPVSPLPTLDSPVIVVRASLSGASPETMASSVATPLERSLGNIAGIDLMQSSSSEGSTSIFMIFDLDKDVHTAAREVQAAINAARPLLPSSMKQPPTYRNVNPSSTPVMVLALTSDLLGQGELYDLASTILAQKLAQVRGVGEVTVGGSSLPAVRVDLNPNMLNNMGVSLDTVRNALAATNSVRPKGFLDNNEYQWQLATNGQLRYARDFENLIVAWNNGSAVRLRDVAHVYDSTESLYNRGFYNTEQAVVLLVRRQADANIIQTVDSVKEMLPDLAELLPPQVRLDVAQDRTPSIRAALHEAELTLVIAVLLVIVVVMLFLQRIRATLIPAISVPISLLGTFIVMYFLGYSLNTISLMALIVATGFVVDDSIVVLENVMRYIERGMHPMRAALLGAREVGFTVVSMSVSLVAVFIPLLFMGGLIGRLFLEFAMTLSVAIGISLIVSLTLTPMMCAQLLRHEPKRRKSRVQRIWDAFFDRLVSGYGRMLRFAIRFRFLTLLTLLATVVLNVYLYIAVPKGFFPEQDTGMIQGFFRADQGTSFAAAVPKLEAFRKAIVQNPNVDTVSGYSGGRGGSNSSFFLIQLKPFAERTQSATEIINDMRKSLPTIPGARLSLVPQQDIRAGRGGDSAGSYQYDLLSGDLETLRKWVPQVRQAMATLPELVDVQSEAEEKGRRVELIINRESATRLNVEMSTIAGVLNNLFSQRQVSTIYSALNQYQVVMGIDVKYAQDPEVLKTVQIIASDGKLVPLSAFASFKIGTSPLSVSHQG